MIGFLRSLGILIFVAALAAAIITFAVAAERDRREVHSAEELAPKTGHYLQSADVRLFVQEEGPAAGPSVVFVPGPATWSEQWRQPMSTLARQGYHAIALDLPPFGFSQRPQAWTYDKRHQALRIIGLLDAMHIDRAILVGHSLSAGPVVEAAIIAPQRISGLLLVDPMLEIRPRWRTEPTRAAQMADKLVEMPLEREWLVGLFLTNPGFTRPLLEMAMADSASARRSWVTQLQLPLGISGTTEAVDEWLATQLIKARPGFSEFQTSYPWLKMPMVLIRGKQDWLVPMEEAELISRLAPQSRLLELDWAGHLPQMEDPDGFSQQLVAAMKTLTAPGQ
jgi:pimeloyl-ACP methyl ester carboxylesterase